MTAKEKADELIEKFTLLVPIEFGGMDGELAIQCALIYVGEIIDVLPDSRYTEIIEERVGYWEEVKEELQKL